MSVGNSFLYPSTDSAFSCDLCSQCCVVCTKTFWFLKQVFSSVKVHQAVIPTYQGGIFSLTVASNVNLDKEGDSLSKVEEEVKSTLKKTIDLSIKAIKSSSALEKLMKVGEKYSKLLYY